jgi:hypothetical protein
MQKMDNYTPAAAELAVISITQISATHDWLDAREVGTTVLKQQGKQPPQLADVAEVTEPLLSSPVRQAQHCTVHCVQMLSLQVHSLAGTRLALLRLCSQDESPMEGKRALKSSLPL